MYCLEGNDEWTQLDPQDIWVYNKLQLSALLGYQCGPVGTSVPSSGLYIVRPVMNFLGMGRNSRIEYLKSSTDHLHPGEFWCEVFKGEHLSVDFYKKECVLVVKGHKNHKNPLYKWSCWSKINKIIGFPPILSSLIGNYEWINCEFIGNKLIEVQLRRNPDFRYENTIAIPV
jgi:hypothetical protein